MLTGGPYIFPNLIAQMAVHKDTLSSLSKYIGMGYQPLSARLQGKKSFELPEVYKIMERYQKPFDYLFERIEQENSAS